MINIPYDASGDQCDSARIINTMILIIKAMMVIFNTMMVMISSMMVIIRTLVVGILVSDGQGLSGPW